MKTSNGAEFVTTITLFANKRNAFLCFESQ